MTGEPDEPILQPDSPGRWLARLAKGIAVGVGAILPGLSGGVLAVIFRLYDPMIRFLADMRRQFVRNALFFLPVAVGLGIGVLLFSAVVEAAFGRFMAQFVCLFIGFVVGTVPSLYRRAGARGRSRRHLVILAISAVTIFTVMLLGGSSGDLLHINPNPAVWVGAGALIGLGVVIPGMSPSNFLIYFGLYDQMAADITDLAIGTIIPLAIGVALCVVLLAKTAAWAFDRYHAGMHHLILGMVVGSSAAIFPTVVFPVYTPARLAEAGIGLDTAVAFGILMLALGAIGSWLFSRVEDRVAADREVEHSG